jgi:hypothetical protein
MYCIARLIIVQSFCILLALRARLYSRHSGRLQSPLNLGLGKTERILGGYCESQKGTDSRPICCSRSKDGTAERFSSATCEYFPSLALILQIGLPHGCSISPGQLRTTLHLDRFRPLHRVVAKPVLQASQDASFPTPTLKKLLSESQTSVPVLTHTPPTAPHLNSQPLPNRPCPLPLHTLLPKGRFSRISAS